MSVSSRSRSEIAHNSRMDITDRLLSALEVQVEPFAICDVRCGCQLDIQGDDHNTIHYALAGRGLLSTDKGESIPLDTDQMILVPRGTAQRVTSQKSTEAVDLDSPLCVQPADGLHWLKAGSGTPDIVLACGRIVVTWGQDVDIFGLLVEPIVESFADSEFIRTAFETMLREFSQPQLGTLAMASTLMKQCLILLLRRLHERRDWRIPWLAVLDNPRLEQPLRAMLDSPEKNHRVEDLADLAYMSRSSFSEHFSRTFGQPPHEFLAGFRLRRAAQLLANSDLPVKLVADRVGYQSRSSFSRAFKSAYGKDPAGYRKSAITE